MQLYGHMQKLFGCDTYYASMICKSIIGPGDYV